MNCLPLRAFALLVFLLAGAVQAQVPNVLNYQGRVAVGAVNFDGTGQFKFALVNANASTTYWSNDGTSTAGGQPAAAVPLTVTKGLYSLLLGDTTLANMTAVPASVFANPDVRLRVWFSDGVNGFQLMTPDQRVAAVGYALVAGSVPSGSITSSMLAPGAVQSSNIASGAVGGTQLASGAAAANLNASGLAAVPSGGIVGSNDPASAALLAQGFVRDAGAASLGESWTPMPSGDAVAGHTAVWTGTELLIWGGVVPAAASGAMPATYTAINRGLRYNPTTGAWTPISTVGAPQARYYHNAVWTGTQMIVWGGQTTNTSGTPATTLATGGIYTPATDTWSAMAPNGIPPMADGRNRAQAFWTGTDLLIWGGNVIPQTLGSSFPGGGGVGKRYHLASNTWSDMAMNLTEMANGMNWSGVWTGSAMILWSGQTQGDSSQPAAGIYRPAADTWQTLPRIPGDPALPTTGFSTVWTGTEMILWGGVDGMGNYSNAGYRFDPVTTIWTAMPTTGAPAARAGHYAVSLGGKMVVWGGQSVSSGMPPVVTSYYSDGGIYDPVANTWQSIAATDAPPCRTEATVTAATDRVIVWAGIQTPDLGTTTKYLKHGGSYQPASSTWTVLANGSPAPRFGHSAIWTGTELIVWGGQSGGGSGPDGGLDFTFNDGARYNPATGVWTPLPSTHAPSGRVGHAAVWTGTEMIIWGGSYLDHSTGNAVLTTLNTGARYNPQTNTWTPTSMTSAPSVRSRMGAVWAGAPVNQMLIWGGLSDGVINPVMDGGRYDPGTNTWSSISTTNAPNVGGFSSIVPVAVWSGTEMLFFGTSLMNGGRYYPLTDTWLPLAATPAGLSGGGASSPSAPLWAGTGMAFYVPGSTSAGGFYFYSPVADYWQTSATTGGPAGFFQNLSTVWTGTTLMVWGGAQAPTASYTGGIYTQATDTWSSLPASGAPAAAFDTSVWTGAEMLLWGGTSNFTGAGSNTPSDQGYRYHPAQSYYLYRRP